MTRAYIGLGANLGDPPRQLRAALAAMAQTPEIQVLATSSLYRSVAIGLAGQPDYCNAACAVETSLSAQALFEVLLGLERAAGRMRDGRRWGPRTLDLDLLVYGDQVMATPKLTLPHPEIAHRNFVLAPLAEIAPELVVTGLGRVNELAARIGREGLAPWSDRTQPL